MKKIVIITIGLIITTNVFAQTDSATIAGTKEKNRSHYFGFNAGFTTGVGFSFIYQPKKDGIQFTFFPLFDKDDYWVSTGLTYLRTLEQYKRTSIFLYVGNHLLFSSKNEDVLYFVGVGPGIDVGSEIIRFRFSFGLAVMNIPSNVMVRPTGEIGLFYKF